MLAGNELKFNESGLKFICDLSGSDPDAAGPLTVAQFRPACCGRTAHAMPDK